MDTRDQTLTKLTRLHGKSHLTHHRPASLRWNYSRTAVSIMKLVMEDGWRWRWRRISLSGAQNRLQICPPEEEQGLAAAPYYKTRWIILSDFFLPNVNIWSWSWGRWRSRGPTRTEGVPQGVGAPRNLVAKVWAPFTWFFCQYFLLIPKIISMKFQVIPRASIFAQK